MKYIAPFALTLALAGCVDLETAATPAAAPAPDAVAASPTPVATSNDMSDLPQLSHAAVDANRLGTTIASLGDPDERGRWVKTPLVTEETPGLAVYAFNGRGVKVTLIPSGGVMGGGSQISLAAMQLLELPLTLLPELVLYRDP